jgi:putative oxidoreductase
MLTLIRNVYEREIRLLSHVQPVFLLLVRVYWGWQFFITGRGKLMNLERTAEFFGSLNIPFPLLNAWMAGLTECVGGLLLLAGLASRISTIPLICTMLVAYGTAHTQELRMLFSHPDAFVSAPPFLFLLASLIVLLFGPGWISADALIGRYVLGRCPTSGHAIAASVEARSAVPRKTVTAGVR